MSPHVSACLHPLFTPHVCTCLHMFPSISACLQTMSIVSPLVSTLSLHCFSYLQIFQHIFIHLPALTCLQMSPHIYMSPHIPSLSPNTSTYQHPLYMSPAVSYLIVCFLTVSIRPSVSFYFRLFTFISYLHSSLALTLSLPVSNILLLTDGPWIFHLLHRTSPSCRMVQFFSNLRSHFNPTAERRQPFTPKRHAESHRRPV